MLELGLIHREYEQHLHQELQHRREKNRTEERVCTTTEPFEAEGELWKHKSTKLASLICCGPRYCNVQLSYGIG